MVARGGSALLVVIVLGACYHAVVDFPPSPRPSPSPVRSELRSQRVKGGWEFWPSSAPVQQGIAYVFDTGHCGLDFLTDFDGSFWDPISPKNKGGEPSFFYSEDQGTMLLASNSTAYYTSSAGTRVRLIRDLDPEILKRLCD